MNAKLYNVLIALFGIVGPIIYVLMTGDFPGATLFYGMEEDEPFVDALITLSQRL